MNANTASHETTAGISAGDKIRLLTAIDDDGEDHHLPGRLASAGETLVVRDVLDRGMLAVSHEEITTNSFVIYLGEYETVDNPVGE